MAQLCELSVGSVVKVAGIRCVVMNPAKGVVSSLSDYATTCLSPSAHVTHFGEASGNFIQWKTFDGESAADNPENRLQPAFSANPGGA
jgi:hypothetical protein